MNAYLSDKIRVVSFFAMVLLTLVHAYTYPSCTFSGTALSLDGLVFAIQYYISQGLAKFRVPMFFILSGYFFMVAVIKDQKTFRIQFIKRVRTIALPYLLWSLLGLSFYAIVQWPTALRSFFPHNQVWGLAPMQLLGKVLLDPIPYQLWFLRDLMVLFALSPLINRVVHAWGVVALIPPLITWLLEIDLVVLGNESLPFFTAGVWLALRGPSHEPALGNRERLAIVVGWLLLLAVKTTIVVFQAADVAVIRQLHHLAVFWGLVAIWVGYDLLVMDKDVRQFTIHPLTHYSFFLYVSHEPLLTMIKKSLFMLPGHGPLKDLLVFLAAPMLTISICLAMAVVLRQHAPRIYGVLTGDRGAPQKITVRRAAAVPVG